MKALQKYSIYARDQLGELRPAVVEKSNSGPWLLASEADAAIAEMRQKYADDLSDSNAENEQLVNSLKQQHADFVLRLQAEHAEEMERLKAENLELQLLQVELHHNYSDQVESLRKQAERYEKLRKATPTEFERIFWGSDDTADGFDSLVDQLPASGEASVDEQHGRVE